MAAITALFLHCLKAGDHVVMSDVTYAAASELANDRWPRLGIEITRVDTSDAENVRKALRPNTKLVYLESPANPLIRLTDVAAVSAMAHDAGALVAVDSTFSTPIGFRPAELGADFVIQSLTKYICGHGDAIGGSIAGRKDELVKLRGLSIHVGGVLSPFNAWLILRGAATLPIRMAAHEEGALAVARHLEKHPKVTRVIYPGLSSHPQYELATRQLKNFSGMLTFQVADGPAAAKLLSDRLQVVHYAVSLGHHRSLVCYLATADLMRVIVPSDAGAGSLLPGLRRRRRVQDVGGPGRRRRSHRRPRSGAGAAGVDRRAGAPGCAAAGAPRRPGVTPPPAPSPATLPGPASACPGSGCAANCAGRQPTPPAARTWAW